MVQSIVGPFSEIKLCICQCSGTTEAVVAIPETNPVFEAPVRYAIDSLTEKVIQFGQLFSLYNIIF